jgi:hypothetical protein
MYTRRLYYIDEVRSAFLYSLKNRRVQESFFWLQELEDSNYGAEARRLLFLGWLIWIGISSLEWLHLWSSVSSTREGRLQICWKMLRLSCRDASIWNLLWSTLVSKDIKQSELLERWNSMRKLESNDFWEQIVNSSESEKLDSIYEALQISMKHCSLFAQCSAFVLMTCDKKRLLPKDCWKELSCKPYEELQEIDGWKNLDNVRKARVFSIPYDCLFGMTWRGTGVSTLENLRNLTYSDLKQSPAWKTLFTGESEEEVELFWDLHFPWTICDHPDEWSLADQKKSHGEGSTGATATLERWWRNWCVQDSLLKESIPEYALKKFVQSLPGNTDGKSVFDKLVLLIQQSQ